MKKKQQFSKQLQKTALIKRKTSPKAVAARQLIRGKRPIHRQIALQPVTMLTMMCVGVLLCVLTFHALADTVVTTATVPAPPLTQPAVIESPTDGLQTSSQALTVSGSCPSNSYVNLTDNAIFVGTYMCTSNAFQISLDLSAGSNQLQAQDYNITNSPGPQSAAITVIYTPPTVPGQTPSTPPIATPTTLQVTQLDTTIPYTSQHALTQVSNRPTFAGVAPPYSRISIVITPGLVSCTTYANAQGYWSCRVPTTLQPGIYTITITATTPEGAILTVPSFKIEVTATAPPQVALPPLFHITSNYLYSEVVVGQPVNFTIITTGGRAAYAFTIQWGDGAVSTIVKQSQDTFTVSHTYGWINVALKKQVIRIQAIDTTGQSSTLQLETLVRNPAYVGSSTSNAKPSRIDAFFNALRPWLWLIWPGYAVIILLVFSFWLGEREELAILMKERTKGTRRKRTHAQHP